MIEDVTTSGKSMEETVPKVRGAANVEIVGLMVSLDRMEVGKGGVKCALEEVHDLYGFETNAIVTMEEVIEHLYNKEYKGEIIINDDNQWECPVCHNKDHSKMNVTRRTCGYLGENFWNVGKTKEINARVLHL